MTGRVAAVSLAQRTAVRESGAASDASVSPAAPEESVASKEKAGSAPVPEAAVGEVLSGYLTQQTVQVELRADDKESAIREMSELPARTGKVADVDELVATALRREVQGTTGLGKEIAIPHAKTDAVTAPVVGLAGRYEGEAGVRDRRTRSSRG